MPPRIYVADLGLGWALYAHHDTRDDGAFYAVHQMGRRVDGLRGVEDAKRKLFEEALDG